MAWFSGGLSQFSSITDQISSFTKDVLTETTEEVEDPAAELLVARKRIAELESSNTKLQEEWERLKAHNDELSERADTAELQISTFAQEYRKRFQDKEDELLRLKVENQSLREQQRGLLATDSTDLHSPLKELASVRLFSAAEHPAPSLPQPPAWSEASALPAGDSLGQFVGQQAPDWSGGQGGGGTGGVWGEEFHDFSDVINSQSEINRLQSELSRLRVECQHWRNVAQEKASSDDTEMEAGGELAIMRTQMEELQRSLEREQERHHHEVAALQSVHEQKLLALSQRHAREVSGSLQQELAEVSIEEASRQTASASPEASTPLQAELEVLKTKCSSLEAQLAVSRSELDMRERAAEESRKLLEGELSSQRVSLEEANAVLSCQVASLTEKNQDLESGLREHVAQVSRESEWRGCLVAELEGEKQANRELQEHNKRLNAKNASLQEVEVQMTAALEIEQHKTTQLHDQIKHLRAQFTTERDKHLERETEILTATIAEMQASIEEHEDSILELEAERERAKTEAGELLCQVECLIEDVRKKEAEVLELRETQSSAHESDLSESDSSRIKELDRENAELRASRERLQLHISELELSVTERQNQCTALAQMQEDIAELRTENIKLETELHITTSENAALQIAESMHPNQEALQELQHSLDVEVSKRERLQEHLAELAKEHDAELTQLVAEKETLECSVADLREEINSSVLVQNETMLENSTLKAEKVALTVEGKQQCEFIARLESDLDKLRLTASHGEVPLSPAVPLVGLATVGQDVCDRKEGALKHTRDVSVGTEEIDYQSDLDGSRIFVHEAAVSAEDSRRQPTAVTVALSERVSVLETERLDLVHRLEVAEMERVESQASLLRLDEGHRSKLEQCDTELSALRALLSNKDSQIVELNGALETHEEGERNRLKDMEQRIEYMERQLEEKDVLVKHHQQHLAELGELLSTTEQELERAKQDIDLRTAKEKELLSRVNELQESVAMTAFTNQQSLERETLAQNSALKAELESSLQSSAVSLEEARSQLLLVVTERDKLLVDLRASKIKVDDISNSLERVTREQEEALALLREQVVDLRTENGQLKARLFSAEQGYATFQSEMEEKLVSKETERLKYCSELERLRKHLIEVEEQHTREGLEADERETGLRKKITQLTEQLKSSSSEEAMLSHHSQRQLASAQEQLRAMMSEKKATLDKLAQAEEEVEQTAKALQNLQEALEQFQRDQSSELNQALKRTQTELADTLQENGMLLREKEAILLQLQEASTQAQQVACDLREKDDALTKLTSKVKSLQGDLAASKASLDKLSNGDKVDRCLVKNMVLGYVHATNRKKPEVLQLISRILDFSQEELDQALGQRSGWLTGLWQRPPTTPPPVDESLSLSRLFVQFLESESSGTSLPPPSPSFPPPSPSTTSSTHLSMPSTQHNLTPNHDRPSRSTFHQFFPVHSPVSSPSTSMATQPLPTFDRDGTSATTRHDKTVLSETNAEHSTLLGPGRSSLPVVPSATPVLLTGSTIPSQQATKLPRVGTIHGTPSFQVDSQSHSIGHSTSTLKEHCTPYDGGGTPPPIAISNSDPTLTTHDLRQPLSVGGRPSSSASSSSVLFQFSPISGSGPTLATGNRGNQSCILQNLLADS